MREASLSKTNIIIISKKIPLNNSGSVAPSHSELSNSSFFFMQTSRMPKRKQREEELENVKKAKYNELKRKREEEIDSEWSKKVKDNETGLLFDDYDYMQDIEHTFSIREENMQDTEHTFSMLPKTSMFLVSLNSNKTEKAIEREYGNLNNFKADMFLALNDALCDRKNYVPRNDPELSPSDIFKLSVEEGVWESGNVMKRLHLHSKLTVIYNGMSPGYFHVMYKPVLEDFRKKFPGIDFEKGPYLNVRYLNSVTEKTLASYINKELQKNPKFTLSERNGQYRQERQSYNRSRHRHDKSKPP